MTDEKMTIYISPEEDLTSVRERLEKIPARYITLVIPTETQLRSHVAWKLLRARVRELGKEVQIVSTDAQIRSVAKDVNFKVAPSLEASPTSKPRASSRPGRSLLGGKSKPVSSTMSRSLPPRGSSELRGTGSMRGRQQGTQWSPSSTERPFGLQKPNGEGASTGGLSNPLSSPFGDERFNTPDRQSSQPYSFNIDTSPPIRPLPSHHEDEEPDLWAEDFHQAQDIWQAASQGGNEKASFPGSEDDSRYDPADSANPVSSGSLREAPEDYKAQSFPRLGDDPFAAMDDDLPPPPAAEQRGSVQSVHGFETREHAIQDVPDMPTEILHGGIEYEGDQGDFVVHSDTSSALHQHLDPIAEEDVDRAGPPRPSGGRPRSNRAGRKPRQASPGGTPGLGDDSEALIDRPPQAASQKPRVQPVSPAASGTSSRGLQPNQGSRSSGSLQPNKVSRTSGALQGRPATRISGNLQGKPAAGSSGSLQRRSVISGSLQGRSAGSSGSLQGRPSVSSGSLQGRPAVSDGLQLKQGNRTSSGLKADQIPDSGNQSPARNRPVVSRPPLRQARPGASAGRQGRASVKSATRRKGVGVYVAVAVVFLVLCMIALVFYIVPSATVTVTLPAQDYAHVITLTANPDSQTNAAAGVVHADTLKKDFTISGTGQATGNIKVGTASATGIVYFTNNTNQQIVIPSNILVTTNNGTQFVTQAEVSLGAKGSSTNRLPTMIQAQDSGNSGNVGAGSITTILATSLSTIAQRNNVQASSLNLQVSNDIATTGGGIGNATSVVQKDLDKTQADLSSQLQGEVNTWLQAQVQSGDVAGKPIITPTLTNAPKVNDIDKSGTFSAQLTQSVEVLLVRNAALQKATIAQLDTSLQKDTKYGVGYEVVSNVANALKIPSFTPVSNGQALTLKFTAQSKIIHKRVNVDDVSSKVIGKSVTDAAVILKGLIPDAQNVDIHISPNIFPVVWRMDQIQVNFVAGSSPPKK